MFEMNVEQSPEAVAAIYRDQSITYRVFNEKVNQLAHYLRVLGVKPDTLVALCMDRSIELLITMMGILKAGGAYVPLDASHPEERLLFTLTDSDTKFLIIPSKLKEKFIHFQGIVILLDMDEEAIRAESIENPSQITSEQNLAYVIYTSGSTGKPKGVLIERHSVVSFSLWLAEMASCQPQQRIDFSSNIFLI